jgi:hypothetical protein
MNYTINSKGTSIPKDKDTLRAFQAVQREANRFQDAAGKKLLVCDGKIGNSTVTAVEEAKQQSINRKQLSDDPYSFTAELKNAANQRKLALVVGCPKGIIQKIMSPEPIIKPDGTLEYPSPTSLDIGGIPLWLIAVVGIGGIVYIKKTRG